MIQRLQETQYEAGFTENGIRLSGKIKAAVEASKNERYHRNVSVYTKCSHFTEAQLKLSILYVDEAIQSWAKTQMEQRNAILFIGACGIAVRAIAPWVTDKLCDSPVLVMDEKGQYKVAHSQNTADLSRKLCKQLGLNEKTTDLIYYAGLLQNIGKITLPESLFSNKGKLSKEEWEKLQNHPNVGVNLLMNINFLSEVIPYIHYHKERWDGRGEPEGLKGNSIPFGSRIIAVADAYTAMTSDRSYRKAMAKDEALKVIKDEAGVKWDPIVVNALFDVVNN